MENTFHRSEMMQFYDEVLAQSARNYALTMNKIWEQRYRQIEPISDKLLKNAIEITINDLDDEIKDFFLKMNTANQKLVKMEYVAIDLVNDSKHKQAIDLLDSDEYLQQRIILASGLEEFTKKYYEQKSNIQSVSRSEDEIIKLEKRLAVLEKSIEEEKFNILGHFASRMAHDLRNPLSVINATLDILKMKYGVDETNHESFERCERAIDRIAHQVHDVLDFVQEKPLHLKKIPFSSILKDTLDSCKIPFEVKLVMPKKDIEINCDGKQLVIVFTNLILNAIHALNGHGLIVIGLEENNDNVIIEIEDSGDDIPKDTIDILFEPLFTTKQQGTGLGLASVKSIINNHGGTISVKSPPTIFTITLPKINS